MTDNITRKYLWSTPFGRAFLGFSVDINNSPEIFLNDEYIVSIINEERSANKILGKTLVLLLSINTISILYVQGLKIQFTILGSSIPFIPASGEVLCFLLGLSLFAFVTRALDVVVLSRIRWIVVNKKTGTELALFATAHLKGENVWCELIIPKYTGFSSNRFYDTLFGLIFLIIYFLFFGTIFTVSLFSMFSLFTFGLDQNDNHFYWPLAMSISGVIIALLAIIIFLLVHFVRFKFTADTH